MPHGNDLSALQRYEEKFSYDESGNIQEVVHTSDSTIPGTSWTRLYEYATTSNRLLKTYGPSDLPGTLPAIPYDPHGSMTSLAEMQTMSWDFADRFVHANKVGGGDVYFTYDASGERVRKVHEHSGGGRIEERLYLGGFEIYRRWDGPLGDSGTTLEVERETLHVMDDQRRIAMVETKNVDPGSEDVGPLNSPRWRFQLGNHLDSAAMELDEASGILSYEEYHPYGSTAFHTAKNGAEVSAKRYRYTGKEKDEETGLYYHGARYYAAWLGRWTAADPAGLVDGLNLYRYSRDNPIRFSDPSGTSSADEAENKRFFELTRNSELRRRLQKGEGRRAPAASTTSSGDGGKGPSPSASEQASKEPAKEGGAEVPPQAPSGPQEAAGPHTEAPPNPGAKEKGNRYTQAAAKAAGKVWGGEGSDKEKSPHGIPGGKADPGGVADNPVGQGIMSAAILVEAAVTVFSLAKLGTKLLISGGKKLFQAIAKGIGKLFAGSGDDIAKGAGRAADAAGDVAKGADEAAGAADDAANQIDDVAESSGKNAPNSPEPEVNKPVGGAEGEFSVSDWNGYPSGVAKPSGPFRLLEGAEYDAARKAANRANAALRRADPGKYAGKQIHEIHPVKFGGSPTDPANKVALTPAEHAEYTAFWNRLMRDLQ